MIVHFRDEDLSQHTFDRYIDKEKNPTFYLTFRTVELASQSVPSPPEAKQHSGKLSDHATFSLTYHMSNNLQKRFIYRQTSNLRQP
jgi:hypothetical protein